MPRPEVIVPDFENDPVAAYDRIAWGFASLSGERKAYLERVEQIIVDSVGQGARALIDIGSGDGKRARRIAEKAAVERLVLVEPSAEMRAQVAPLIEIWPDRAEFLDSRNGGFDVLTCLWNVLGHVFPADRRMRSLRGFARMISPSGQIFIDVNHRYNASHYGYGKTALRILKDLVSPNEANGDVVVDWKLAGMRCRTAGHVFTHPEFAGLCRAADLRIVKRHVIDYGTGEIRGPLWTGHLLYELSAIS